MIVVTIVTSAAEFRNSIFRGAFDFSKDRQKGEKGRAVSRVTSDSSSTWDFCLIFETRVLVCRNVKGCTLARTRRSVSLEEGAKNKFMTRNENWSVVKVASYAPIGMILADSNTETRDLSPSKHALRNEKHPIVPWF